MNAEALDEVLYGTETAVATIELSMNDCEKYLSVLFADVSGSARLHEKLGEAEALRAVDRCLKRMERGVEGFGGRIIKTVCDELMAVFDNADEALQAAIEMQQRVGDLPPVSGVKLAIRVGFSHGLIIEEEGGITGETVSEAARLAGLSMPGQILTSSLAQANLSAALQRLTRDIGSATANGTPSGTKIFEVIALDPDAAIKKSEASSSSTASPTASHLCVRYDGQVFVLDGSKKYLLLGRAAESDIVIHDRRASRNHAKIERRGDKFVLIDISTNGTYVTLTGQTEFVLHHAECVLQGKGVLNFVASSNGPESDCIEFEQVYSS